MFTRFGNLYAFHARDDEAEVVALYAASRRYKRSMPCDATTCCIFPIFDGSAVIGKFSLLCAAAAAKRGVYKVSPAGLKRRIMIK